MTQDRGTKMIRNIETILCGISCLMLASGGRGYDGAQDAAGVPNVTREYLLAHGFKRSAISSDVFTAQNARLSDISRDLGFPLASLRPTKNQPPDSDVRNAVVRGIYIIVRSEVRDPSGRVVRGSLDKPDAICTVTVSLGKGPVRPVRQYLPTTSVPRLRIRSVTAPQNRSKPLVISIEFAAEGTTPVVVDQSQFGIRLSVPGRRHPVFAEPSFPEETPRVITVQPGQPTTLTIRTSKNSGGVPWGNGPSGDYRVRIDLGGMKAPVFDYQWVRSEVFSDEFKFAIKWPDRD
jgi:hypothetical protein